MRTTSSTQWYAAPARTARAHYTRDRLTEPIVCSVCLQVFTYTAEAEAAALEEAKKNPPKKEEAAAPASS